MIFNQIKINLNNIIYLLLLLMHVCAIAGNLLININITLVSILGISLIIKNNRFFFFKEDLELILFFFFFFNKFFDNYLL